MFRKFCRVLFCVFISLEMVFMLRAQGTAFTYQGRLNDGGSPASGNYDFSFAIYDTLMPPGNLIAGPITNSAINVSNGLFTATLDFGSGIFTGTNYWLSIGVRTNGSSNAFTPLLPRQQITPTPYAIFASKAGILSGSLPASQLSGALPSAQLNGTYINTVNFTNNADSFSGNFFGNGTNLINLNASQLAGGTVADARLSTNVALLNTNQTFIGSNAFAGPSIFANARGAFQGTFSGTGSSLSNLDASQLTLGTVADAQLSANVALLNGNQTFSGANTFTSLNNSFRGSFFGNGLVGWIPTNGTAVQAISDTGYLLTNSQLVTVTLPASPSVGDIVRISGAGASGWQIAQNASQSVLGNFLNFTKSSWILTSVPSGTWYAIASSADGTKLLAAISGGAVYFSADSGVTWTTTYSLSTSWHSVACSSDGSKMVAAAYGGNIYTNSGYGWAAISGNNANWASVTASADGNKLAAAIFGGAIYTSTNFGATWTQQNGAPTAGNWQALACSADGSKLIAANRGVGIYVSTNSGVSWSQPLGGLNWYSVASSADGGKLAAVVNGGGIYTSSNFGASWTEQTSAPTSANWVSIASSADGSKLAAVVSGGGIYLSSNYGVTWIQQVNAPVKNWNAIASSADGGKLAAVVNGGGGIYVAQAAPQSTTTMGTNGFLIGSQGSAVELQYFGNNQWMPISSVGTIWTY